MIVDGEEVAPCVSQPTIPALRLPSLQFLKPATDADEKDVQFAQDPLEPLHPFACLNDIVDDEIVARSRHPRDRARI
jgi:hypothetical protein